MIYPCWWNLKQNKQQLFNAWDFGRGASADQIITVETEADSCPKSYSALRSCFLLSEAPTPSTIESIGWWRSSIHILHYFCQGQESASVWQVCRSRYTLGRCWEYERQVSSRIPNWAHDVIPSTVHDTQRSCVSPDHAKSCREIFKTPQKLQHQHHSSFGNREVNKKKHLIVRRSCTNQDWLRYCFSKLTSLESKWW